jgi:glycosyltransferase involved in cell wall biosynthesis
MDGTKKVFPNSNTILLPYGFDLIQTKALIEKINTKFIIAFCGRLDMHTKGLDAAIDAFIEFQKNKPHVSLRIIGDGNDRIILQKRAGLAINKIEFCGSKYGDEKIKLLAESHLFIHPSRNEGLPTAVLEAASLGLPSLVTVATNVGTYVQKYNAGVVINSTTNNDVLEGLEKLYANYQLNSAELMNNSKKMVSNEFNWQTIIAQLNSIYKQALC